MLYNPGDKVICLESAENGNHEIIKRHVTYTIKDVKQCPRCNKYFIVVDTRLYKKDLRWVNIFRENARIICSCGQPIKKYDDKLRQWRSVYSFVKPDEIVDEHWIALGENDAYRLKSIKELNEL